MTDQFPQPDQNHENAAPAHNNHYIHSPLRTYGIGSMGKIGPFTLRSTKWYVRLHDVSGRAAIIPLRALVQAAVHHGDGRVHAHLAGAVAVRGRGGARHAGRAGPQGTRGGGGPSRRSGDGWRRAARVGAQEVHILERRDAPLVVEEQRRRAHGLIVLIEAAGALEEGVLVVDEEEHRDGVQPLVAGDLQEGERHQQRGQRDGAWRVQNGSRICTQNIAGGQISAIRIR